MVWCLGQAPAKREASHQEVEKKPETAAAIEEDRQTRCSLRILKSRGFQLAVPRLIKTYGNFAHAYHNTTRVCLHDPGGGTGTILIPLCGWMGRWCQMMPVIHRNGIYNARFMYFLFPVEMFSQLPMGVQGTSILYVCVCVCARMCLRLFMCASVRVCACAGNEHGLYNLKGSPICMCLYGMQMSMSIHAIFRSTSWVMMCVCVCENT